MKFCMGCMEQYEEGLNVCPYCGYAEGTPAGEALHMSPGEILQERYIVGRVLGFGGFGVTYIGWDAQLERKIAIKEYLPSEFSTRMAGQTQVMVFTDSKKQEQYRSGMLKFIDEAQRLAKFQNEDGIVKIFDSFEANNTAYIIMEFLDGETLADMLGREGVIPAERAFSMLAPVITSLRAIHEQDVIHRDIAPDNIFLTRDGKVKVIDFGAARFATTAHSRSLTVIIKPGYSPEEQYRSRGDQGKHTDVYAVGAVLYRMITGSAPPDALERRAEFESRKKDILKPPSRFKAELTVNQETVILNALNVRIEDRTPDMTALLEEMASEAPVARRRGRIAKIDVHRWPLWAKILAPAGIAAVATLSTLFALGIIGFESFLQTSIKIPEGMSRVPSVVNSELGAAEERLVASSLVYTITDKQFSTLIPADFILTQDLSAGSVVPVNSLVQVTMSGGAETKIVPKVEGQDAGEITEELRELGYAVKTVYEYSAVIPEGGIIRQDVPANSELAVGETITLIVSMGRDPSVAAERAEAEIPEFAGLDYDDALLLAADTGFIIAVASREYNSSVPEGGVISQSPAPGADAMTGDEIRLVVSLGAPQARVPDVQYKKLADAVAMLEAAGLSSSVTYQESDTVAKGSVISQDPPAKSVVEPGDAVYLVVSAGREIKVPGVTGISEADARTALGGAGLSVAVQYEKSDSIAEGNVIRQSPASGATASKGDAVTITVSSGKDLSEVPEVTGQKKADAQSALESAGFKVTVNEVSHETVESGAVISQSPAGGTMQQKGSRVVLTVSTGPEPVIIPDVTGMSQSLAEKTLRDLGFSVSSEADFSDNVDKDKIISQSPKGGSKGKKGDAVTLTVSLGVKTDNLPDVSGLSLSAAQSALQALGVTVNTSEEYDDNIPEGSVISQSPQQGTIVKKGDTVTLKISRGPKPVSMPSVTGKSESDARAALDAIKLNVSVKREYSETVAKDTVISQSPQSGAQVRKGDAATITVSDGREPISIPDLTNQPVSTARPQLEGLGFKVDTSTPEYSPTVPKDSVISQDPRTGTGYKNDVISLKISLGKEPVTVQAVTGDAASAKATLEAQGLIVKTVEEYNETIATGSVISQSPQGNTQASKGDTVTLTVSLGKQPRTLPSYLNAQWTTAAESALTAWGVKVNKTEVFNEDIDSGSVVRQTPSASAIVYSGDTVTIEVSKGREPTVLVNYKDQSFNTVRNTLVGRGIIVTETYEFHDTVSNGSIISHTPAQGTLYRGDSISFVVSKGPDMVTVPNVVNLSMADAKQKLEGPEFNFTVSMTSEWTSGTTRGNVIRHTTGSLKRGSTVELVISNGPDWSAWQDTQPTGDIETQTRTVYRYRFKKKETRTSTSSNLTLSGWNLESKTDSWPNEWKNNGTTAVTATTDRQVNPIWHDAVYWWRYNRWVYWENGKQYSAQNSSYGGTPQEIYVDNQLYNYKRGETHKNSDRFGDYEGPGPSSLSAWWWNETRVEKQAGYNTYEYRDKIYTYVFWQWDVWAINGWVDFEVTKTNERDVETKTQYCYRGKSVIP
ncbi:MAG: PASTA domain-containing protein [Oscillospiraceae bacterium]|nr:PASTA domain-containing protein [Oscillospiraceae bacterium]